MTDRQARYQANLLMGMKKVNAAIMAGYSKSYANCSGKKLGRRNTTKYGNISFLEWLDRVGVTPKTMAEWVKDGIMAVKGNGHPDWQARSNYMKNLLMIFGYLKEESSGTVNNINIRVVRHDESAIQSSRLAISNLLGQN